MENITLGSGRNVGSKVTIGASEQYAVFQAFRNICCNNLIFMQRTQNELDLS